MNVIGVSSVDWEKMNTRRRQPYADLPIPSRWAWFTTREGGKIKLSPFLGLHEQAGSQVLVRWLCRWHLARETMKLQPPDRRCP